MKFKYLLFCALIIAFNHFLTSCDDGLSSDNQGNTSNSDDDTVDEEDEDEDDYAYTVSDATDENEETHEETGDYTYDESDITEITLSSTSIDIDGDGASLSDNIVTISSEGTYRISGTSSDAQVHVDTDDDGNVQIILNGADMTCSNSAPIFAENAEKVIIILADNTDNYITDASTYEYDSDEDEPNAAIHSKADLSITGTGSLTVTANYNDGITSKDGLIIKEGTFNITAADDGIRGKDYLVIDGGTFNIESEGDGFKSDNDEDSDKGYILINNGSFNIDAGDDGIQATTDLLIAGGTFDITTGGGSESSLGSDNSAKGLKSDVNIITDGGTFDINSADDAVHTDGNLIINDGNFTCNTGDDGFHADYNLEINGGDINIEDSYEGIESLVITINDGNIIVNSSDDGLNAAGGDSSSSSPGFGGGGTTGNCYLYINGGYLALYVSGDGLDSNGDIQIEGGTILIHGPKSSSNSSIDFDDSCLVNGGTIIGAGSSGMLETISSSSDQYSVIIKFSSSQSAGTMVNVQTSSGTEIFTFTPEASFQAIQFSTPELTTDSYVIYTGGSHTGTEEDGYYTSGTYTTGTQYKTFTISSKNTTVGSSSNGSSGGGGGGGY